MLKERYQTTIMLTKEEKELTQSVRDKGWGVKHIFLVGVKALLNSKEKKEK